MLRRFPAAGKRDLAVDFVIFLFRISSWEGALTRRRAALLSQLKCHFVASVFAVPSGAEQLVFGEHVALGEVLFVGEDGIHFFRSYAEPFSDAVPDRLPARRREKAAA